VQEDVTHRRGRRSRLGPLAAALAVLVVAGLAYVIGSSRGDDGVEPPAAPPSDLWAGTATLLQLARGPVTLCGGAVLTSLPPAGCGGPEVLGLDPMDVPGAERFANGTVTTPSVRLVGTWDGTALTVTEPFELRRPTPEPAPPVPGPSCTEPQGGWPFDRVDQAGWGRLQEYMARQPDAGVGRVDTSQRIFTAPFTGDLERHRRAMTELYDGPLCLELVERSRSELMAVFDQVQQELERRGLRMLSGSPGGSGKAYVEVNLIAITDEEREELEGSFGGRLRVTRFLEPQR
jgi:hypothetical protein